LDTCLLGHLQDPVIGGCKYNGTQLEIEDAPGIGADVGQEYLDGLEKVVV